MAARTHPTIIGIRSFGASTAHGAASWKPLEVAFTGLNASNVKSENVKVVVKTFSGFGVGLGVGFVGFVVGFVGLVGFVVGFVGLVGFVVGLVAKNLILIKAGITGLFEHYLWTVTRPSSPLSFHLILGYSPSTESLWTICIHQVQYHGEDYHATPITTTLNQSRVLLKISKKWLKQLLSYTTLQRKVFARAFSLAHLIEL